MEEKLETPAAENPETVEATVETAAPPADPSAERDQLAQELGELQERMLRLQADYENSRKRMERERMEFAEYAGEQTIRAILPILDDFERALAAGRADANAASNEFLKGVELIYTRLLDTLKRQGVEPIATEGEIFDPHQHEAVGRVESSEHEDGAIVRELQRGYKLKGRLLRPSMVQVAVKF